MNALADCVKLIYNKLGLFKPEGLTMIIDCYYHFFYHLRRLYNNICKQILSYLFNLALYLRVFISFIALLEVLSYVPS